MKRLCFGLLMTILAVGLAWGQIKLVDLSVQPALAQDLRDHARPLTPIKLSPEDAKKYEAEMCGEFVAITLYKGQVCILCHLDSVGNKNGGWLNMRYTDVEVWLDEVDIPTLQLIPKTGNSSRDDFILRISKRMLLEVARCLPSPSPPRSK